MKEMNYTKVKLITYAIINYRLSMKSLYELFKIEKMEEIINANNNYEDKHTLEYILGYETVNSSEESQKQAKTKTLLLFTKFRLAKTKEDKIKLLSNPEDSKAMDLIKKNTYELSKEDRDCLFRYRYRHALKISEMASLTNYPEKFYYDNEPKTADESLKSKLVELNDYHQRRRNNHIPKK